ncbi:hypothetical protein F4779DRAFT_561456 [Xylariaceae sp. FL0662B]|nr:hypothetical protein F4779DRAFT_561456 [Xylariaceae sp. FL0662B]
MKLTSIAALLFAGSAAADFHIVRGTGLWLQRRAALPSNKYDCEWFGRFGEVTGGNTDGDWFKVTGNLCGVDGIDFWKQKDGTYKAYKTGTTDEQATCYKNTGERKCSARGMPFGFNEAYVCYSYLCK